MKGICRQLVILFGKCYFFKIKIKYYKINLKFFPAVLASDHILNNILFVNKRKNRDKDEINLSDSISKTSVNKLFEAYFDEYCWTYSNILHCVVSKYFSFLSVNE